MSAEILKSRENLEEVFIVRGAVEYSYILGLEEKCKMLDIYQEMTGINIFDHVKKLLDHDPSKDVAKTS